MHISRQIGLLAVTCACAVHPIHAVGQETARFADNERRMIQAIDHCRLEQVHTLAQEVYTLMVGIKGTRYVERATSSGCIAAIPMLAEAGARIDMPEAVPGGMVYKAWFNAGNAIGRRDITSDAKHELWSTLLETFGFPTYWIFSKSMTLNVVSLMTAECGQSPALDDDLVATLQLMVRYSSPETVLSMAYEPANPSGKNPMDYAAQFHCPKTIAFFDDLRDSDASRSASSNASRSGER